LAIPAPLLYRADFLSFVAERLNASFGLWQRIFRKFYSENLGKSISNALIVLGALMQRSSPKLAQSAAFDREFCSRGVKGSRFAKWRIGLA
jgi:hypothetical protein